MNKALTLAGLLVAFTAVPAIAHEWSDSDRNKMLIHMMAMMDMDGDGFVSQSEHEAGAEEMFANADVNKDGQLSKQEITEYAREMQKEAGVRPYAEPKAVTNPRAQKNR